MTDILIAIWVSISNIYLYWAYRAGLDDMISGKELLTAAGIAVCSFVLGMYLCSHIRKKTKLLFSLYAFVISVALLIEIPGMNILLSAPAAEQITVSQIDPGAEVQVDWIYRICPVNYFDDPMDLNPTGDVSLSQLQYSDGDWVKEDLILKTNQVGASLTLKTGFSRNLIVLCLRTVGGNAVISDPDGAVPIYLTESDTAENPHRVVLSKGTIPEVPVFVCLLIFWSAILFQLLVITSFPVRYLSGKRSTCQTYMAAFLFLSAILLVLLNVLDPTPNGERFFPRVPQLVLLGILCAHGIYSFLTVPQKRLKWRALVIGTVFALTHYFFGSGRGAYLPGEADALHMTASILIRILQFSSVTLTFSGYLASRGSLQPLTAFFRPFDTAAFLSALYSALVWTAWYFLRRSDRVGSVVLFGIAAFMISYFLLRYIVNGIRKLALQPDGSLAPAKKRLIFLGSTLVTFLVMMIWFKAYYPGSFSPDSIEQYEQAISGKYNDWHPVLQTLVTFTLPLKVFGTPASIIFTQIICFSLISGYLSLTICELGSVRAAVFSVLYFILNPYAGIILLFPWKDVTFALAGLLSTAISVRMICRKEGHPALWETLILGVLISCTAIFRHNGILYAVALLFVLFLNLDKKTRFKIAFFSAAAFFIIKVPVYQSLHVTKPGNRVTELMGLPLTVIGNTAREAPQLMDEELAEFVYAIAPENDWKYYECGNFNELKFRGIDTSAIESKGYSGVLRLMAKCFKLSPKASMRALLSLTDLVYGFTNGLEGEESPKISVNSFGISYSGKTDKNLQAFLARYSAYVNNSALLFLRTYGVCLFILLVIYMGKLKFRSRESLKKASIIIPIFAYDFGTMLLLTGPDSRFFFITFWVTPLLIVYALRKPEDGPTRS